MEEIYTYTSQHHLEVVHGRESGRLWNSTKTRQALVATLTRDMMILIPLYFIVESKCSSVIMALKATTLDTYWI